MRNFKKIVTVAELKKLIQGRKIALAHGVFDVFHIGHLKHLEVVGQSFLRFISFGENPNCFFEKIL